MFAKILLVEDDFLMRRSLDLILTQAGYQVVTAAHAEHALELVSTNVPDLILLDIGLPGMDGLDALRQLKQLVQKPVIFLTARQRQVDEVIGLELGADDYLTKPFNADVLLARIKVALRRNGPSLQPVNENAPIQVGNLTIDPTAHLVKLGNRDVKLSPREFDLLHVLASQPGRVFSIEELIENVWGTEFEGEAQVVYVHIRWLRQKIEENPASPKRIVTRHSIGYKLEPGAM